MEILYDASNFPLKRDQIPVKTFEKLWDELRRVLKEDYQLSSDSHTPGSAKFFGMGDFAPPHMPAKVRTVASVIAEHENVKKLIETFPQESVKVNFGDYLYKRLRQTSGKSKDKPKPSAIAFGKRPYIYGYFLFLGFPNREAFETAHGLNSQTETPLSADSQNRETLPPTRFLGSFFSFRSYLVKHFIVTINFNSPEKDNVFPAEEWGFHRLEDASGLDTAEESAQHYRLSGTALIRNNKLYVNLTTPETEHIWNQMNIIGWGFGTQPLQIRNQSIIRCNVQTVSVIGYPVAAEAILVRIDEQKWNTLQLPPNQIPALPIVRELLGSKETDTMLLYLLMQRRNFWIRNDYVDNLLNLQFRGNLMRNFLYLKGTWRVWNYGLNRGHIIQSKLVINEHYAAIFSPFLKPSILETNPGLENQVATLSISRGPQPNKLFFYTFVRPNLAIINSAMFDLNTIATSGFAEGMFLTGGYDAKGIIGGYCVMKKLGEGEEDFQPREFTWQEAHEYEKVHNLTGLYEGLRDLWRRKTWIRRKKNEPNDGDPDSEASV